MDYSQSTRIAIAVEAYRRYHQEEIPHRKLKLRRGLISATQRLGHEDMESYYQLTKNINHGQWS